jgi:DNA invertase Pin-like site-specific DNA recombinase
MFVCHSCDTKLCVNPRHLFIGSHSDNVADAVSKKTIYKSGNRTLSEESVRAIIRMVSEKIPYSKISDVMNTSPATISRIKNGSIYKEYTNGL